jgi:isopentenyldiphosphate isomerase
MEEMVAVVNRDDRVIGKAIRKGIHKTGYLHRAVHIFLVDSKGRIWLELRGANTDIYPGHYSSSAAGHVRHGETYLEGARREVLEELGIRKLRLVRKHKLKAAPYTGNEFITFYVTRSDKQPVRHRDAQKQELFSVDEIDLMIERGEKLSPVLLRLFSWYKGHEL